MGDGVLRMLAEEVRAPTLRQVADSLGFTFESVLLILRRTERFFYRHQGAQVFIHRLVHRPHPTLAQFLDDAVAVMKNGVRGKHLFCSGDGWSTPYFITA